MKEAVMVWGRNIEKEIAAILNDDKNIELEQAEQARRAAIKTIMAKAAFINDRTEAGKIFSIPAPGHDLGIDELDLRTQGRSEAVALALDEETIFFQATATSALVRYIDWNALHTVDQDNSIAAD